MDYVLGIAQVEAMDSFLCSRHELIPLLKQNLISAQARMKLLADQHRFDKSFSVGDWVYLKLQPYRQLSLWVKGYNKLSSRFWLFSVLVRWLTSWSCLRAAQFTLFSTSLIWDKSWGDQITPLSSLASLASMDFEGTLLPKPIAIMQQRSKQLRSCTITEILVQWQGQTEEDATWESLYALQHKFPHLVGKVLWEKGSCWGCLEPWGQGFLRGVDW